MSRKCANCSHVNPDRQGKPAKFCARCGRPLDGGIVPPPPRHYTSDMDYPSAKLQNQTGGQTDGMAIAAMVCGIVGMFMPIVGIVALILGVNSNNRINRSNGMITGKPMAMVGIICGTLALLGHLGFCCLAISNAH